MNDRWIGFLLLVATTASWGGAWVTARAAAAEAAPEWMAVGRFIFAAATLLPVSWALRQPIRIRHTASTWKLLVGMALTGAIGYNIFFLIGIQWAPASDGAVITPGLAGFSGGLIAWALNGDKPRPFALYGGMFALVGAGLIGLAAYQGGGGSARLAGNGLFALAALVWGLYTVFGKRISANVKAVESVFWAMIIATILFVPYAWWQAGPPEWWGWAAVGNMAYLGLIATGVGFVTWFLAVQRLGADRAGPGLGLVPFFGVTLAAIFIDEVVTWQHIVGGLVVILGIVVSGEDGTLRLRIRHRYDAAASEIWEKVADFGNLHKYSPDLRETRILDGPQDGIGAVRRNVFLRPQAGIRSTDERITDIGPHAFTYEVSPFGPYRGATATWAIEGDARDCSLNYEATLRCGLLGWLLWPLTRRNMRAGLHRLMAGFANQPTPEQSTP